MINIESIFNQAGTGAVIGTQLMEWLGISPIDFSDPHRFSKFRDIIDYLKKFPEDTQRYIISKVTQGKPLTDKLAQVWEYSQLLGRKESYEQSLTDLSKEREILGPDADRFIVAATDMRYVETKQNLDKINNEIALYEK